MITSVYLDPANKLSIEPAHHRMDIIKSISAALNLLPNEFYLTQNGKILNDNEVYISDKHNVYVHMKLLGGKGGFGSMLRAIGAQIEKTTNREACRDLSGRRLRDINEEKRLKAWLDKQGEREEEAAAKRAKKIEKLRAKPKHEFKDDEYFNERSNLEETVSSALEEGLKNATEPVASSSTKATSSDESNSGNNEAGGSGTKRKNAKPNSKKGKKKIKGAQWLDDDLGSSSDDSSDDDSDDSTGASSSKSSSNPTPSQLEPTKTEITA